MFQSYQDPSSNVSLPHGMIVYRIMKVMGVDISKFPVKEISSTYNDRAFSSMSYIFYDGCWIKKASYKTKVKTDPIGGSSGNNSDGA